MTRVRIQLFNQPIIDGRVYVAENKEVVEKLFAKYLVEKPTLFLTDKSQETDLVKRDDENFDHFAMRFMTVDLMSVAGKFENIEIIVTDEIGIDELPVIEVWADLKILDNDRGKYVESMFETNVATFGMRSIAQCYPDNKRVLTHVISYDLVSKKV
jgi:hypothetical protein